MTHSQTYNEDKLAYEHERLRRVALALRESMETLDEIVRSLSMDKRTLYQRLRDNLRRATRERIRS